MTKAAMLMREIETLPEESVSEALVLASALENDCKIAYSEDMQNGQIIENTLKIVNPFAE